MKANNTSHRLKRTAVLALFLGVLVCVGLFATGCKRKGCGNDCLIQYFIWDWFASGRNLDLIPCSALELKSGDLVVLDVYTDYAYHSLNIRACSDAPWTLTATPSAGIRVWVELSIKPYCKGDGDVLGSSPAPGEPVTISGPAGCITTGTDALRIGGFGAIGTITVEYN